MQLGLGQCERINHHACSFCGEDDVLGTVPERHLAERPEVLIALENGQEVVAGELADDAREPAAAVRQEDLGLAKAAGVEEDLAGRGVAGVVLEADAASKSPIGIQVGSPLQRSG